MSLSVVFNRLQPATGLNFKIYGALPLGHAHPWVVEVVYQGVLTGEP